MGGHFKSPTLTFRFRVVDLRDLNGGRFLDSGSVGDQILALLMRLTQRREAIRRILGTIATLDARAREEALSQLVVICGLRGIETEVEEEIKKVPVLNSLLDRTQGSRPRVQEGPGTRAGTRPGARAQRGRSETATPAAGASLKEAAQVGLRQTSSCHAR